MPSLLGDGDKGIEIVSVREKYFVLGRLEQPRQNKNLLYRHDKPSEPTREGPLSCVLFESPFTSVSTDSGGHPSPGLYFSWVLSDSTIFFLCILTPCS
ncbi:MAG: hypothetical protein ACK559_11820, partial [bacterium]